MSPEDKTETQEVDLSEFMDAEEFSAPPEVVGEEVDLNDFLDTEPSAYDSEQDVQEESLPPDELKKKIAAFYLNKQLEESLLQHGDIPTAPVEAPIGIGFVDIVEYSYLASWLSPRENQIFLNGLYTAFHSVLKKRGGYLNKISGDSLMFHYGGNIDPIAKVLPSEQTNSYIAQQLLETCIEIQQTCRLFNQADKAFLEMHKQESTRKALQNAFMIIRNLRENLSMVSGINAMFQVKVRIGACLGEVCIGNFGPEGAKQWDVIGEPVIEARRMESTAPVDGLRISKSVYDALHQEGLTEAFYQDFVQEASLKNGYYRDIRMEELFGPKIVILQDKNNVDFDSYAVQTNPLMPEDIREQVKSYLGKDEDGADRIVKLLQYHRGNRLVIQAIEDLFKAEGVFIRKDRLYKKLHPVRYYGFLKKLRRNEKAVSKLIQEKVPLFILFKILGHYQDSMHKKNKMTDETTVYNNFDQYLGDIEKSLHQSYEKDVRHRQRFLYFNDVLFPFVFAHIKASILEYQSSHKKENSIQIAS